MSYIDSFLRELSGDFYKQSRDSPELSGDSAELSRDSPELSGDSAELSREWDSQELSGDSADLSRDSPELSGDSQSCLEIHQNSLEILQICLEIHQNSLEIPQVCLEIHQNSLEIPESYYRRSLKESYVYMPFCSELGVTFVTIRGTLIDIQYTGPNIPHTVGAFLSVGAHSSHQGGAGVFRLQQTIKRWWHETQIISSGQKDRKIAKPVRGPLCLKQLLQYSRRRISVPVDRKKL